MTLKMQNTASEYRVDRASYADSLIKEGICHILKFKISGLGKGVIIPDDLIAEAEDFMHRNMKEETSYQCCRRCMKAHLLKKVDEFELGHREKAFLEKLFEDEIGHNGYYLDGERVIKI